MSVTKSRHLCSGVFLFVGLALCSEAWTAEWKCETLPPERETIIEPESGAEITFLTDSPAYDQNLYFHQRSWLPDGSLILFHSDRTGRRELFGYLEKTGELIRLQRPDDSTLRRCSTASRHNNIVYVMRDLTVYAWAIGIEHGNAQDGDPSRVTVTERPVGELPKGAVTPANMTENSDGTALSIGYWMEDAQQSRVILMNTQTGECDEIAAIDDKIVHVQSSWCTPDLVYYARLERHSDTSSAASPTERNTAHMWLVDSSGREPREIYKPLPGEFVTHTCWWVDDRITFCTGMRFEGGAEESHVKVIDIHTGVTRIVGAGSWWPGGTGPEVSRQNWWHQSGSPDGRWIAADNWHGDIAIFSGHTARTRILARDHRTYGEGEHPHVGWDPSGTKVIFASNRRGNVDLCVGALPDEWLERSW